MKRFILLGTVLMLAFSLNAQPDNRYYVDGDRVLVEKYYEDGTVKEEGSYLNNEAHGKWVGYYPDGSIQMEAYYNKGQKEGKWYVYSKDGNYLYEVVYEDNLMKDSNRWKIEQRNLLAGE